MKDTDSEEETILPAGEAGPREVVRKEEEMKTMKVRKNVLLSLFMAVLVSIEISAISLIVYDRYFATRIVAVDIKGFIASQRDLYVQGKISDEELRQKIETLDKTIQNIPSNVVVVMGDAIVRNAKIIKP